MILKIFRVVWFFSVLGLLGFFMYTYAALPETIVVIDSEEQLRIGKEIWFYVILFLVAFFNMLVYVFRAINRSKPEGEAFVTWFYGQVICLNLFVIVAVSYVSLFNGGERFEYQRIGIIIYGSIALMVAWAFGWPAYLAGRRIFPKKEAL